MDRIDATKIKLLQSAGCFSYIDSHTDDAMREIFSCREYFSRILSPEAAEEMKRRLSQRLIRLHLDVLFELLLEEIKKGPGNDDSPNSTGDAAARLGKRLLTTAGAEVYEAAPLLSEMEQRITEHFINAQTEFLTRFYEMCGLISERLFGGKPVTVIRSLHNWGAPRWQGRMPVAVETDAGTCYYKPRDCRIDAFYHDLVKTWFSDVLKAPSVVPGNGYGFCEEIVSDPVRDPQNAAIYVRNLGILLAVFTCLNGNDLKCCNIIPSGIFPAAIDVETLIKPQRNDSEPHAYTEAEKSIRSSVACTAFLFRWDFRKEKTVTLFDEYEILRDTLSVSDTEELLSRGFREGYFRILRIRRDLPEKIKNYGDMMLRVLLGNTHRNLLILGKTWEAPYLKSLEKREKLFAYLPYGYEMEPEEKEKLLRYDTACFLEGEVPVYSSQFCSRGLYGKSSSDLIGEKMLMQSPREHLLERLSRMSAEECAMNEEIIRRITGMETESMEPLPETDYSQKFFRKLVMNAVLAPDGTLWWYSESSIRKSDRKICLCFLQADAATYCSALLHSEKQDAYEAAKAISEIRNACLAAIVDKISRWETVDLRLELPAGLLQGMGGLLLDMALMERLGCTDIRDTTDRLLKLLSKEAACQSASCGLMNGIAGLLTALWVLPERGEPGSELLRLRLVRTTADALLCALQQPEKKNAHSRNPDPFCGSAGAGLALLLAMETLKEEKTSAEYTDTGIRLLTKTREDSYAEATGLCAAAAIWFCKSLTDSISPLRDCLEWAIAASAGHEKPAPDDTLYHGNALRALFWLMAGKVMNQASYREKAKIITEEIQRSDIRALGQFDASLLKGDLGTGLVAILIKNDISFMKPENI